MTKGNHNFIDFLWRTTYAHTIAYFVAGLLAVTLLGYREHYASESLSVLMRPVDAPITALGPALQIVRGMLMAIVLYPFRSVIFSHNGWWKLALLILGLSQLCTIGPTPGSFDGVIYTKLPMQYHLLGLPEAVVYVLLFTGIMAFSYTTRKRYTDIVATLFVLLIIFMGIMGYLTGADIIHIS
ncbi:MAG: hypothetical protein NC038_08485 [Paludibacter sp.]|nr:hypothetical protein [Bacteroidales bacterium]MCM1068381.1 hypothetical protein [Prevotella sp.]MCM1354530.1 hypothetical protein [Bacteroides sp.]MCM1443447.1 hypothetical protein [Muribaculum sp.]MCM1482652.1 hypothetical protein [Paludibacter sp.]